MTTFTEYKNLIQIHDGEHSRVYRGRRIKDDQPVILKVLKAEYPSPDQLRRYRQEYYLAQQLKLLQVIQAYELMEWHRTLVIIFEDFGGDALKKWLKQYPQGLPLDLFWPIAIKIASALGQLHSHRVIHKDLNPSNIVFNATTMVLKIIDLGISTQLSRENPALQLPNYLEGTLAYLAPEQTGRMNRIVDYRTDFYSLGVTFYELLTNQLPFTTNDPMELVHCHLAKQPISLTEVKQGQLPLSLVDIVHKLMAKNAEDRYQSAWGLKADLEECLRQWQVTGRIEWFPLAGNDIPDRFHIPQKLYGREQEIQILIAAFERVVGANPDDSARAELILVTGYSGIGKSTLVRSLYQPITARRGYFIDGKYDQFQRNIPYSGLLQALSSLVKQLLGEPETVLSQFREQLLDSLGSNGQVIIDVIPDLELMIGTQPPVPQLGANEAQNRFNLVFQRFIQVFCAPEHPLVIFLDDIQWADFATFNLLELLLKDHPINHLLIIVAYRDHEILAGHPLIFMIAKLQHYETKINYINLAPLSLEQVEELIGETLHYDPAMVKNLAQLVISKTQGNPFFTNQFLHILYSENLLSFNYRFRQWQWNLKEIERKDFTDNVVELMLLQLQKLPQTVQDVLAIAAYLGREFDLLTLSLIKSQPTVAIYRDLKIALEQGLLIARSSLDEYLLIQHYQFGHDRIKQAAYLLIPEPERARTHYQIGQLLLTQISDPTREELIFAVVNQLNYGLELIETQTERDRLAQLNLVAAGKARATSAYQATDEYAQMGISLLGNKGWSREYQITLNLHELVIEAASLLGKFAQIEWWFNAVISQAKTAVDQVKVYIIKIQALVSQNQLPEAISTGKSILKQLGVELNDIPTVEDIQQAILEINHLNYNLTPEQAIERLFDLPPMVDPHQLAIMEVIASIQPACYIVGSPLFPLLVALQVNLSLQFGNSPLSALSYGFYGACLIKFRQDITTATQFSRLAYRIAAQPEAKNIRSTTFVPIASLLHHRQSHLRETLPILQAGYQAGLETGNLEYVGHHAHLFCFHSYWCGQNLAELEVQTKGYHQQLLDFNQVTTANYCSVYWETILSLIGNPEQFELTCEQAIAEEKLLSQSLIAKDLFRVFAFYLHRAMVKFLTGNIERATMDIILARQYLAGGVGTIGEASLYFYDSLILLNNVSTTAIDWEKKEQQIHDNQSKLKFWAEFAPMNYLHKWQLVEAEKYRVLEKKLEAIEFYDLAIAGAKKSEYLQEEALANELAAKFYLNWGKKRFVQLYIQEAHYCYLRWGAIKKVGYLESQYPHLLGEQFSSRLSTDHTSFSSSSSGNSAVLDLSTIMKSSQAIAREMVLEKLLQTLMKILLENAGAQSGCLLLPSLNNSSELADFSIAIYSNTNHTIFSPDQPIDQLLPVSVVNYVARTLKNVVLDDAIQVGNFIHDPYIQSMKPLSILCYPLLNQGKLVGMVYLENQVTGAAFTRARIEFLQLLSGQAAIAITNAQLYAQVRDSKKQLEQFLEAVPIGIGILDTKAHPYYANRRAKKLLGKRIAPEATITELAQVYQVYVAGTQEIYPNEQLPIVRALKGEAASVDDLEIHHGDRVIPLEIWGTPIYSETGEIKFALNAFQDITERKQAEKLRNDYNRTLEQKVAERTNELELANQELSRIATLDGLTKIANRRRFDQYLGVEWQRHLREKQPLTLILMDIDYFKLYNDYYGHQGGDECLIKVAQTLAQIPQRAVDLVARHGGEEFAAILPNTNLNGGLVVANAIRQAIADLKILHAQSEVSPYVTLSLGVATLIPTLTNYPQDLIGRADEALYKAKHQGRNRAIAYTK